MLDHFLRLNGSLRARAEACTAWTDPAPPARAAEAAWEAALAVLLAVATTYIAHYFFEPRLSARNVLYDEEAFRTQYYSGIFAYRVLGRELVLLLNQVLFARSNLYASRAILNGAALIGFNLVFLQLLGRFHVAPRDRLSGVLTTDALVLVSLSVNGNPYTVLSLALIYGGISCAERDRPWGVLVTLVLGTLAHDLGVLILVYWGLQTVFRRYDDRATAGRRLRWTAVLAAGWGLSYGLLRVLVGRAEAAPLFRWASGDAPGLGGRPLLKAVAALFVHSFAGPTANVTFEALLVVGFVAGLYGVFFTRDAVARARPSPHVAVFLSLAVPYAFCLFFIARLVELRLFLPFLPCLVMIGRIGAPGESSRVR